MYLVPLTDWGLRDYGLPSSIWGGDAECEHEWGEKLGPHHPGQVEQTKWKDAEAAGKGQTAGAGQFCQKCGAWLGCLGLEPTPEQYVANMVEVFRGVRRVLRDDGCVWIVIGDSYYNYRPGGDALVTQTIAHGNERSQPQSCPRRAIKQVGLKEKDLVGIPWALAFALRADGWYLRSESPWLKRNPMPGSQGDRPTVGHEHIFLLTKSARYFYDAAAIKKQAVRPGDVQTFGGEKGRNYQPEAGDPNFRNGKEQWGRTVTCAAGRTYRTTDFFLESLDAAIADHEAELAQMKEFRDRGGVLQDEEGLPVAFQFNPGGFSGPHFACYPEALITPMVKAGSAARSCADCGAAYERVTQTEHKPHPNRYSKQADAGQFDGEGYAETGSLGQAIETQTLGFRPTCDCGDWHICPQCEGTGIRPKMPGLEEPDDGDMPCPECHGKGHVLITEPDTIPSLVLDPFGGAGTTALCAYNQGRRAVIIELSPDYCRLAQERLEAEMAQLRLVEPAEVAQAAQQLTIEN